MDNAKKGLRLLSLSIILNIGWTVTYAILQSRSANLGDAVLNFLKYGVLITSGVMLLCYFIDLIGLHIAGKDSIHFHRASFLKIASIFLAIVSFILGIVVATHLNNESLVIGINKATSIISTVTLVAEVVVLASVIKGCKEISPRVSGQANFTYVLYVLQILIMIVLSILASFIENPSETLLLVIGALSIVYAIAAVLYAIFYVILILRATVNVGKSR